jgi:hypothetical protein
MLVQDPVTAKSGVVDRLLTWMVVVPILVRVTVCGADALPPEVAVKVREPCERV